MGRCDVLLLGSRVVRVGAVDIARLDPLGLPCEVVDASDCVVVPGFIDAHAHLIGGAGEQGFRSRTREIDVYDLLAAGVTSVVGCLGTDTTTRHLTSLLAKVRQLRAQGLSAYMLTGGFRTPPPTLLDSVQDDLVLIEDVIGVGEVAIADVRALEPTPRELARMATEALVGGSLGGKAGCVVLHVGPGDSRLGVVASLLNEHEVPPAHLQLVHISRSAALMDEAIELARRGVWVAIDTVDEDLPHWLAYYLAHGGPPERLGVCSDAQTSGGKVAKLQRQFVACIRDAGLPLDEVLPLFTTNVAAAWRLEGKGALVEGMDADVLLLDHESLAVRDVFARGQRLVCDGEVLV
jgi:beta-aspartyl-dipeptidase (metallo-type)